MKIIIVLATVLALVASDTYTPENDNLNIDALVNNKDGLQAFIDCFLDKGPCDPVSQDFKNNIGEAVREACAKCTPAQKHIFKVFLEGGSITLPAAIQEFKQKYDPENKYFKELEQAIANN